MIHILHNPKTKCWTSWKLSPFTPVHFWTAQITWRHCALCTLCVSSRRGSGFSDYSSVEASTLLCAVVCWGENINAGDADRTNKLVIKAVFVAGLSLNTLEALAQERRRTKLNSNLDNPFRPAPSIMH